MQCILTFDAQEIPLYKRIISYLHPVWIRQYRSEHNPHLELLMYKGRIQLATEDALYSDGNAYTPALAILKDLKDVLPQVISVLLLGVGLGSTASMIRQRGYSPAFTLVELDEVILELAMERLSADATTKLEAVCANAEQFVANNTRQYDLVFIDIFNSRTVPPFVSTLSFLSNCRKAVAPGGHIAFNYIVNDEEEWAYTQKNFASVFPKHHIISSDINKLFVGEG